MFLGMSRFCEGTRGMSHGVSVPASVSVPRCRFLCACGRGDGVYVDVCIGVCRRVSVSESVQATITLTGSEDIEKKLVAVANGLRVFIIENPAPEKPMLGEAHARE